MELFPPIEPYHEFFLQVSNLHAIHVEECGNPSGKPLVVSHGGPVHGVEPHYRQNFNPEKWRMVLFDQRGCGKSTPFAELRENTTWHLVSDIERIRTELGTDRWVVFGGSWGSTLAIGYAETHPDHIKGLILRGIFMLRQKERLWLYQDGASNIYPDAWEYYLAPIPEKERSDLLRAFYRRLTSEDRQTRTGAAKAWSIWEGSISKLFPDPDLVAHYGEDKFADAFARIECYYFVNKGFFDSDDQLLRNVNRIRQIPGMIVQGRYNVVCPMISAWELHRSWPEPELQTIPDADHSMTERGIRSKLVEYTEKFSEL